MASVFDVGLAIATQMAAAINALAPTYANTVKAYVGYPNMPDLTKRLEQGESDVAVFPLPTEKLTTRFMPVAYFTPPNVPLVATVNGGAITFSGSVIAGLNVTTVVNVQTYSGTACLYQTLGTDTLTTVAAGVASAINALTISGLTASAAGAVVTITGSNKNICNVGGTSTTSQEVRRTERQFQVTCYAPDALTRLALTEAMNVYMATVYFLQFPDGSFGRVKYVRGPWDDDMQRETMMISHQVFSVDFGTISSVVSTQIGAVEITETPVSAIGQNGTPLLLTEGS